MNSLVRKAIDNSLHWLARSESSFQSGDYHIAVYELEMAGEVALKSLIMFDQIEIPRKHDVSKIIRTIL
jgi:HEPN domain-containing protein